MQKEGELKQTRGEVPWAKIGQLELYNGNNLTNLTSATGFCPRPTLPLQTAINLTTHRDLQG